jgi:hypothetical protein
MGAEPPRPCVRHFTRLAPDGQGDYTIGMSRLEDIATRLEEHGNRRQAALLAAEQETRAIERLARQARAAGMTQRSISDRAQISRQALWEKLGRSPT